MTYTSYPEYTHATGVSKYKVSAETGIAYHIDTSDDMCALLDELYRNKTRVRVDYGNTETGQSWGEVATGTIDKSAGVIQVPLLIAKRNSYGGPSILDHRIVRIDYANKREVGYIYKHYQYQEATK